MCVAEAAVTAAEAHTRLRLALEHIVDGPEVYRVEDEGNDDHDHYEFDLGPGAQGSQQPYSCIAEFWCQSEMKEAAEEAAAVALCHLVTRLQI